MGLGQGTGPEMALPEGQRVYTANARSALFYVVCVMAPGRLWLPSYLCKSMLVPNVAISLYDDADSLKAREGDLVVDISYFGFPIRDTVVEAALSSKAWLLEDASMSLYSTPHPSAHFIIYSTTKSMPLPDGGVLVSRTQLPRLRLDQPPTDWFRMSYEARRLRTLFDSTGEDLGWFALAQHAKRTCPTGLYAMSDYSRSNLGCVDHNAAADSFTRNYARLGGQPVPSGVVPSGFPVYVGNRDQVLDKLYQKKIYPPVHWRLEETVPIHHKISHQISKCILTLPCDPRYDIADMDRIVSDYRICSTR